MNNETQKGGNHRTEVHRDIVQIITGVIIIIAIVYIQKVLVEGGLMLGIILGIILVDIAGIYKNSSVSKVILHFERHNVQPGLGTLWFIAGLMILIAFTERWRIIEIGVFAMAIGDSLATIGGVNIKSMKLFYNKKKSVGGFFCMLIPTAVFAYLILGPIFIILAVIATFAESVSRYPVDDNISIPISVILSRFIFSLI
jgi:dolichol kinase